MPETAAPAAPDPRLRSISLLLAVGWAFTNIAYAIYDLPLKFVLKDQLHLDAPAISMFFALGVFSNYVKPLAGILTDCFPLFGTRRRGYLLLSLLLCGIGWLVLGVIPRRYGLMLGVFAATYTMVMVISTTLGGVMVEAALKFQAAGRLTAQRIGMFRVGVLAGAPLGGFLASLPLIVTMSLSSILHFILIPIMWIGLKEDAKPRDRAEVLREARAQLKAFGGSKVLLPAAVMICLIGAAPGFGTPLFFHQTDTLHLSKQLLGNLGLVSALSGIAGATFYYKICQTRSVAQLLSISILIHGLGTLFYLFYRNAETALAITALEGFTQTIAVLPVYDLAARGTPKGSEALGYAVMMSVWNLTNSLSDWIGSQLFKNFHLTFHHLVWLNSGTTLIVLLVVPLLPAALLKRTDGESPAAEV